MAILQYWPSDPFHPAENIYLQLHRLEDYSLKWDIPATEVGRAPMEVNELVGLEKCFAIIGRQYLQDEKRIATVARFVDFEGKSPSEPRTISSYKGKPGKDLQQKTLVSPGKKCMLWEGRDGSKYYASAWGASGRSLWEGALEVPHLGKYHIAQSAIADDATLYLLLTQAKPSNSMKDVEYPPLLLAYNSRTEKFVTDTVQVDSAFAPKAWLTTMPTGEVVVAGVWSRGPASHTILQYESSKNKQYWAGFFLQRSHMDDGTIVRDTAHQDSMPDGWIENFGVIPPGFGDYRLVVDPELSRRVILIAEETSLSGDIFERGRLGLIAFDPMSGALKWDKVLGKKQRDRGSERFLSYLPIVANGKLHLIYLSEMGAPGKIMASSFALRDGDYSKQSLADNFNSDYLFLPQQSGTVSETEMVLVGLGDPTKSDFKFLKLSF
jgi:hypothetical protein